MKKVILLAAVVIVFGSIAPAFAAQEAPDGALHGDVGYMYDSMHVWRGFMTWGRQSGSNVFIDLDLMGSGFNVEVVGHHANTKGFEEGQRWDYSLYYAGALNADSPCETRYAVGYRYFNYPELSSHSAFKSFDPYKPGSVDLQEVYAGFAFPRLLGIPGLVPGYAIIKGWPSNSDTLVGAANVAGGTYSGWAHVFSLDYALPISGLTAETPEQTLNFPAETVFNDGVDPRPMGGYTSSDWTHLLLGVSTDFNLGNNLIFTPGLWHQITFEDSGTERIPGVSNSIKGVSPDHSITWASATIKYKF